ncbi:MAG: DNA/RNA non-specific endonuclease, partial [Lachnospiraceae bacterium]|nr:DNA/RNA non-specific endonuclease [Lachnospiraceae bacterium]
TRTATKDDVKNLSSHIREKLRNGGTLTDQECRVANQLGIDVGRKSGRGSVTYGELDSLGRTTGIEATITLDMIGTGSPAKSSIKPAGFGGQAQGHARGHLLGNQLGGSGSDPRNLVTIYQNPVNHPVMSSIEANVRRAVEGGQIVNYKVTPIYEGNSLIPRGITIQAQGSGGLNIYQTILNRK